MCSLLSCDVLYYVEAFFSAIKIKKEKKLIFLENDDDELFKIKTVIALRR